jgi:signal peptidase II
MPPRAIPFAIAAVVVLLDRITKWLIKTHVGALDTHHVIPGFFNIVHAENPGVAFGFLADSTGVWRTIFLIGLSSTVMVFIIAMLWKPARGSHENVLRTGLALVLGGAFGNLFDRVVTGTVTDFLEVYTGDHYFPAFNVADSAITIGACLMLLDMWINRNRKLETQSNAP